MKIVLKKSIADVKEIELREIKAKDLKGFKLNVSCEEIDFEKLLNLAQKLTDTPETIMEELGMEDVTQVIEVVAGFLSVGGQKI